MIRLSCTDFSFARLSFEQCCRLVSWLGIECVDVGIYADPENAHFTVTDLTEDVGRVADRILAAMEEARLSVAQIFVNPHHPDFAHLAANHPDAAVRAASTEIFCRGIELARRVGAPLIGGLPGVDFPEGHAKALGRAIQEATRRSELAAQAGLRYVVEPHVGSILQDLDTTHRFVAEAPAVSLLLDHSHFLYEGHSQGEVDRLLPHAGHIHVRQATKGALQTVYRHGALDYNRLFDALTQVGYDGFVATEFVNMSWFDCDRVDVLSETAHVVRAFGQWTHAAQQAAGEGGRHQGLG